MRRVKQATPSSCRRCGDVLGFIKRYYALRGYSPNIREIGDGADVSSLSVVEYHLQHLVAASVISRGGKGDSRAIVLLGDDNPATELRRELDAARTHIAWLERENRELRAGASSTALADPDILMVRAAGAYDDDINRAQQDGPHCRAYLSERCNDPPVERMGGCARHLTKMEQRGGNHV